MVFTGKRKCRFTRRIRTSADKKDSETLCDHVEALERGEEVPVTAYQPHSSSNSAPQAPRTKQQLLDALECTNSALTEAEADAVEKDKCASKPTKQAEDWKSVAVKERSEKKAAIFIVLVDNPTRFSPMLFFIYQQTQQSTFQNMKSNVGKHISSGGPAD